MVERAVVVMPGRPDSPTRGRETGARSWVSRAVRSASAIGLAGAVVALCLSLSPSLIPRPWLVQVAFTGVSASIGYAAGVLLAWFGRRAGIHPQWSATTRRYARMALLGAGLAAAVVFTVLGVAWQAKLRTLLDMPPLEVAFALVTPAAIAVAAVLVAAARAVRAVGRAALATLRPRVPRPFGRVAAGLVLVVFAVLLFNGTVMAWVTHNLDRVASAVNRSNGGEYVQPTHPERSGSPSSQVSWEALSPRGQEFVSGGPSVAELAEFAAARTGTRPDVRVPIRVYAGAPTEDQLLDDVAATVVEELDRTGAWEREVLLVATPTSTGLVAPAAVEALELMYGGDTAAAAMQYSSVTSWLSFLADRNTAPEAGQVLFEAVYAAWSELGPADRPQLLVFGESLGSYAGHGAFSGLQDMVARTDGALWVATPSFTETWQDLTQDRDPGSPQHTPVYDGGRQVRWGTGVSSASNVWGLGSDWERPRVVYVQHASDAVVWWSSDLLLHQPQWLREPRGPDVLPSLRWFPLLTYWQVGLDMFVAGHVTVGHGHVYLPEYADGWAAIAPPEGWSDADTQALRSAIVERHADDA